MKSINLSLRNTEDGNSRFTSRSLPGLAEVLETTACPESCVQAELRREKARLKLLLEVAKQAVSNQELREVVSAVMMSIRNGILCDGACICLKPPDGGELQVYARDFPDEADFQEGTTIPLFGTIAGQVVRAAMPSSGSREKASVHFTLELLLPADFSIR